MPEHADQPAPRCRYFAFGPFVIDVVRGLLWKDGAIVYVRPKDIELLTILIEARDRVVEKSEIFNRVWPGVVVEENNIARRVSELRRVLGEGPGARNYLATFTGRGYRFVADAVALDGLPAPAVTPSSRDTPPPSIDRSWSRSRVLVGCGAVAVVFAVLAASRFAPAHVDAPVLARQMTFGADAQQEPAWSPDGRRLAYASTDARSSGIFIQDARGGEPTRLTSSADDATSPTWSPDGQWVAFRSERNGGGIWAARPNGDDAHVVSRSGLHPRWSPDGRWILFSSGDGQALYAWPHVIDPNGGNAHGVFSRILEGSRQKYSAWHPDGRLSTWFRDVNGRWRFITGDVNTDRFTESAISPDTRQALQGAGLALEAIEFPFSRLEHFVWAPSGRQLYFEALVNGVRAIWRIDVDPSTLRWEGRPMPITNGVGNHTHLAMSWDGNSVAFAALTDRTQIWSLPLDASGRAAGAGAPVTLGRDVESYARASRDGQVVAYRSMQGSRLEIRVSDAQGDRALASGVDRSNPVLSPDGRLLAYTRFDRPGMDYYGQSRVVLRQTSAKDESTLFYSPGVWFTPTDWSRDGLQLLGRCTDVETEVATICELPIKNANAGMSVVASPRRAGTRLRRASYSPDRRWVAFSEFRRDASQASRVVVTSSTGGDWIELASGASVNDAARWSADGRLVYFISNRGGAFDVWAQAFDPVRGRVVGSPFQVTRLSGSRALPYSVDASIEIAGDRLLLPIAEVTGHVWALSGVAGDR